MTVNADGTFTYTPTAAARHAASATGATTAATTDGFTVTVTDDRGASTTAQVTVAVGPANTAPGSATTNAGTPNPATGVVTGSVTATDPDGDALVYTGSTSTAKGSVTVNADGSFTYTPTAAARHAALLDRRRDAVAPARYACLPRRIRQ